MCSGKQIRYWFISLFIILFFFTGCKQIEKIVLPKKIKRYSVGRVIKMVNDNALKYETLSVKKFSLSLSNDGKVSSVRGSYKIRRDSIIQVYAQKLAIPIGKMEVNTDSFKIVYFLDQKLFFGKNNYLSKTLGMDFDFGIFQALLSNKMFSFRQDPKEKNFKDFVCEIEDNMYKISSMRERKLKRINKSEEKLERYRNRVEEEGHLIKQDIYIDPDSFVVKRMVFNDLDTSRLVQLEFSNYEKVMNQWFPTLIDMQLIGEKKIELSIELSKISLDDEKSFGFSVSPKYKKELIE
jgi:hypothetical protein